LATSPLWLTTGSFLLQLNICFHSPYITSSLTRGWVCNIQLLLALASALILKSDSRRTRDHMNYWSKVKVTLRLTVGQSVSLGVEPQIFITLWQLRSCFWGAPSLTRGWVCLCICCWPSPAHSFAGPCPLGLATIVYCLSFETSLFVASYDSQVHGGGIRTRLHTGELLEPESVTLI
jgi:hypothetical protein